MQFVCRYGTPDGRVLTKVQPGRDADALRRELERQGFHVFDVRPRGFAFNIDWPFRRRRKIPDDEFLLFNQELAALLRAGLPLLQSLELMLERMENPTMREVLGEIRDQVKSGAELSDAFASFGDLFPSLYPSTLKAGERSGELEQVIRRFMRYLQLVGSARRRVVSALIYPAVLITLSIMMLGVLAVYVVPSFSRFYSDLDAELPKITQITLAVSFWLRDNVVWVILGTIAGVVALRQWSETPSGREALDKLRLQIPIVGDIFRLFALSEFCRSLGTLVSGGIPLVSALETAVQSVGNRFIGNRLAPMIEEVREGYAFNEALEHTEVFPYLAINMVKVGEATGSLDEMLTSVSDHFDESIETRVQRLLTLVEPIMLVVMGALIALLLVSIYLPMFGALSQVDVS